MHHNDRGTEGQRDEGTKGRTAWDRLRAYVPSCLRALLVALAATVLAIGGAAGAAQKFLVPDGSRATAVHRIPLMADPVLKEEALGPDETPPLPYSPRATCGGKCHDISAIENGWHFNAPDPNVPAGRVGEPYVLTDLRTGTQIPISPRKWPGTYSPADLGLTPWKFTLAFGSHTPGGGYGDKFFGGMNEPGARWQVSGKLEIDCQSCHSGDPLQDQSLWATNIERQNLQWAATAASGIAEMRGDVRTMPETWDPMTPATGDDPKQFPPALSYDKWRFNAPNLTSKEPRKNWDVFFDVPSSPTSDRCYFCHSNNPIGHGAPKKWRTDGDVHLVAGLSCSDCHRHGLDHMMSRGYEGEPASAEGPISTLTCRGCHLGDQSAAAGPDTMGGRLGAPVPLHRGLPTVHFRKLSCTACHSGPYPGRRTTRVQTSRAHGLGVKAKDHRDDAPPFIQWPVFMPAGDGKIAPHKVLWPAFWARFKDDKVTPIPPAAVQAAGGDALAAEELRRWKPLTGEQIGKILAALAAKADPAGEPVFISGGRLFRRAADRTLSVTEHAAAAPYAWPVAHEVRPASQSLGSGGCTDCHSADAPIFFGEMVADSTADTAAPLVRAMYEFQDLDPLQLKAWAMSFTFRPMFKVVGFATAGLIAAMLLAYVLLGLAALARWVAKKAPQG